VSVKFAYRVKEVAELTGFSRHTALASEEAAFGDLFQVVPRFGTWNRKAGPN